ncbi:MAG TPA: Sir2 family NAD-dependent protein deacetylase [Nocardioides sp.]|uniref:Sir2 family NAD-dependent protein deacetylase n=1 Tax=Nocardioides sp. TaxID=35761 RepID=UPI002E2F397C|nr:Sir2 family NAD-dependent protein deacetylase [Nocardioides sp.]HEX5088509.1 Sir2 family NAD-dependent protein deacetylase [Nocardioides sp.]
MTLAPERDGTLAEVLDVLAARPLVVLTGAGCSTDSGIPDYRGPNSPARMPMTYQEFVSGSQAQQRYWGRSHLGWGRMKGAEPNAGHRALARIDTELLITQNVDGLHERAGSRRVVALHGRIAEVVCLACRAVTTRTRLHQRLSELNPGFAERHRLAEVRPDGDVELDDTRDFVVAGCEDCDGVLKPHVVFFGENVPADRVARCYAAVDRLVETGGALLVAGSSLTVMSGFRFVRRAAKAGTPVVIVNRGTTRGDELAAYRLDTGTSEFLTALAAARRG